MQLKDKWQKKLQQVGNERRKKKYAVTRHLTAKIRTNKNGSEEQKKICG